MSSKLFGYGGTGRIVALLALTAACLGGGIASMSVAGPAWTENLQLKAIEEKTGIKQKRNPMMWLALLGVALFITAIASGVFSADNIYYRLKGIPLIKRG